MQKASFNVHADQVQDWNKFKDFIKKEKPTTVLVLDNEKRASELADLGVPNVILRVTTNDDSIHLKLRNFKEWWDAVKAKYQDKRLIVHFCNEPHGSLAKLSSLCVEGMEILHKEGHRAVWGNFGVGTPESKDWDTSLRPMIEMIMQHPEEFFLGLHEYWMYGPDLCKPYLISRYQELFKYFPRNKIPIIFTEFGSDFIQDVYDHTPYKLNFSGWKDYSNQEIYFEFNQQVFQEFYNADEEVKGVCFFCYGNSGRWDKYNFESNSYFLSRFGEFKVSETVFIRSTSNVGTKRRSGPGVEYPSNGLLGVNPVQVLKLEQDGVWTEYAFVDGNYWLHNDYVMEVEEDKDIKVILYNASEEDVEKIKTFLKMLKEVAPLLEKYNAEIA